MVYHPLLPALRIVLRGAPNGAKLLQEDSLVLAHFSCYNFDTDNAPPHPITLIRKKASVALIWHCTR